MLDLAEMNEGEKLTKEKGGLTASFFFLVGVIRLERTTTCTPCKCASQLRHTPPLFCGAKILNFLNYNTAAKLF